MAVKVILQQDVPNLGQAGEVKQVAPGYFRNFLLPRGLAVEATKSQLGALGNVARSHSAKQTRAEREADEAARRITASLVTIPVRIGEQGRMYGSVTNKDLADALKAQAGVEIDRHKIDMREPLKSIGVHSVPIKLAPGFEPELRVELVPEGEAAQS